MIIPIIMALEKDAWDRLAFFDSVGWNMCERLEELSLSLAPKIKARDVVSEL